MLPLRFARSDRSTTLAELATAIVADEETCEPQAQETNEEPLPDSPDGDFPRVVEAFSEYLPQVEACAAERAARVGVANGRVRVQLTTLAEGEDQNDVSVRSDIGPFIERCIARVARKWELSRTERLEIVQEYLFEDGAPGLGGTSSETWRPRAGSAVRRASPDDTPQPVPEWDPCRR